LMYFHLIYVFPVIIPYGWGCVNLGINTRLQMIKNIVYDSDSTHK